MEGGGGRGEGGWGVGVVWVERRGGGKGTGCGNCVWPKLLHPVCGNFIAKELEVAGDVTACPLGFSRGDEVREFFILSQ